MAGSLNIVAVSGKLYSGKTSLAKNLEQVDKAFWRASLADELKADIAGLCNVTPQFINDNKERFRYALQWYGTDFRRWHNGEDYWVDRLVERMHQHTGETKTVWVIDDVRFPNEVEGLERAAMESGGNFVSIRLEIDKITQIKRHIERYGVLPDEAIFSHPSETALDDYYLRYVWDMVINATMPVDRILYFAYQGLARRGFVEGGRDVGTSE